MSTLFRSGQPGLRDYAWFGLFLAAYLGAFGFIFLAGPGTAGADHPTVAFSIISR